MAASCSSCQPGACTTTWPATPEIAAPSMEVHTPVRQLRDVTLNASASAIPTTESRVRRRLRTRFRSASLSMSFPRP